MSASSQSVRSAAVEAVASARPLTVHIVERMAPGGIETLVLDMTKGMPGQHVVFSLAGTRSELVAAWPRLAGMNSSLEAFGRQPGLRPRLVAQLTARLRTLRPDGVIVHHIGPMIYGGTAARLARVPRILHVEHDAWHYESPRRRALSGLFFRLVRPSRVAVSQEIATKVASYFPGRAVNVIAPGVDMDLFRPRDRAAARVRLGMATDVPLIGTSGRLVPVKSQATLIEALALLRREPNLKLSPLPQLVIVGEGPERGALHALAVERGVAGAVHLLGHRDDLAEVLPSFDIYSLPSLNEGLPRGVLEAQAVGLPVVASNVGALADAVCPETGRLVPAGDAPALAAALADLITHPPDVRISRRFVETRFALATTLSAFNSLLQR